MDTRNLAVGNQILRGVVGSTAHGTGIDGKEDRDEMGVFIEPEANVCGLHPCDHYIYRDKPNGVRSEPGDLDLTLYSLRKFCRLAIKGNPSVLALLWLPEYIVETKLGLGLVAIRDAFTSQEAGKRFLGYLVSQRMALTGERSKKVTRPELVEEHGYDTKFAMHALRLGLQGIELLTTGKLTMPMRAPERSACLSVRRGEINFAGALAQIKETESRLRSIVNECLLTPDEKRVIDFMTSAHRISW